ncbi:MAG: hypothetical protein CM1200mP1_16060 [Candidatus Neomarinimicrobiota bacterium]|nr:MAG: hypothetical protein CM1200mP1_16060 [Candidatus Neomarinimicrobiota bacterium]
MDNQYWPVASYFANEAKKTHPGLNVKRAGDDTLFSTADGFVKFIQKGKTRKIVNVLPFE